MDNIKIEEVKEFQMRKLYATGTSYISALEDETKYLNIQGVEEVMKLLKLQLKGFKSEYKGYYSRWEYLNFHFCSWMFEILDDNDIDSFNELFKRSKEIEISEVKGKYFEIYVTRKPVDTFDVLVKTYTHINMTESSIAFLDEEQGKLMLGRKLHALRKSK